MGSQSLARRMEDGETVLGTFQTMDSAMVSEIAGLAGFDFVILDQEHGPLTAETSLELRAAAQRGGAEPVVRVRENSPSEIQRALDIGASGVEIPQIETRSDAVRAAEAARFAPIGERGLSPYVPAADYDGGDDYTARQNEETAVIIHIEGEEGIANLDEIAAVEGIDVVFIGPYDLSQSLGIPGKVADERVERRMVDICERTADAGKLIGTYADDAEMARKWIDAGAQFVAISVDAPILKRAFADVIAATTE